MAARADAGGGVASGADMALIYTLRWRDTICGDELLIHCRNAWSIFGAAAQMPSIHYHRKAATTPMIEKCSRRYRRRADTRVDIER